MNIHMWYMVYTPLLEKRKIWLIEELAKDISTEESYRIKKEINKIEDDLYKINIFWKDTYPTYCWDKKIYEWGRVFNNRATKWGWGTLEENLSDFTKEGYAHWRILEPQIDEILDEVIERLDEKFHEGGEYEYKKGFITQAINKKLGRTI